MKSGAPTSSFAAKKGTSGTAVGHCGRAEGELWDSVVQCSTAVGQCGRAVGQLWDSVVQCSTVQYSVVQCVQCSTVSETV